MWTINRQEKTPLYQQITEQIITYIETGKLIPDEQLPSERQLAKLYAVNRSTVVRSLDELVSLGWLTRKVGSGTRVAQGRLSSRQTPAYQWQKLLTTPFSKEDPYLTKITHATAQPHTLNLATGNLPLDLILDFKISEMTWEQIIYETQTNTATGYQPLKEQLYQYLPTVQLPVTEQSLLITQGATQAISLLMQVLLKPGDTIVTEDPSFLFSLPLLASMNIQVIGIKQEVDGIDCAQLQRVLAEQPIKLLYLNPSFQNPTGRTMSLQKRKEVLALCAQYQLPIIEDGVHLPLHFNDNVPPLKTLAPEQVIHIGSLSKLFNAQIKVGWILAPQAIIHQLAHAKKQKDGTTDIFSQLLAAYALKQTGYTEKEHAIQQTLAQRQADLQAAFAPLRDDWDLPTISGGLYNWLTWKHRALSRQDWQIFIDEGLLVAPAFLFSHDMNSFRLNYTHLSEKSLPDFIHKLITISDKLKNA